MEALGYAGVLALELFQVEEELLFNEMAPGFTTPATGPSRAPRPASLKTTSGPFGPPLGSTLPRGHSAMANLIGVKPDFPQVLALFGAHLHWYGKEVRPGRKVGHITLRRDTWEDLARDLPHLLALAQAPEPV
ncbi:hypothetical protein [Thermus scotoductus]|uniref:hypothetical protein n=1 Tax=Thermus scotoductus TaxID=37636 RepID=UPI000AFE439D